MAEDVGGEGRVEMNILVTGAAGFIGSVVCRRLRNKGHAVVGLDRRDGEFVQLKEDLINLGKGEVDVIIHLAGELRIAETERDLGLLVTDNVQATAKLLQSVDAPIIFASTDAVYGEVVGPCSEKTPLNPTTNYGMSKLWCEKLIRSSGRKYAILRLFNTVGSDGVSVENLGSMEHIFPCLRRAVKSKSVFKVFGQDHPTKDGTPSRDYVHVLDVADLVEKAIPFVLDGSSGEFNVGSGVETTVRELLEEFGKHWEFSVIAGSRRVGDVSSFLCDSSLARKTFQWEPTRTLTDMVGSFVSRVNSLEV